MPRSKPTPRSATLRTILRTLLLLLLLPSIKAAALRIVPGPFGSGKPYVQCWFDGRRQDCYLDTGSAITLVPSAFSRAPALGKFSFKSASGKAAEAELIPLAAIKLDNHLFHNVRIGRMPQNSPVQESSIGMDLLGNQPFALQFRDSPVLQLDPKPPRETFHSLRLIKPGLITIPVQFGEAQSAALIDTGATVTAVDTAFVRSHPETFRPLRQQASGTDGTGHNILVEAYRAKILTVGPRRFRNVTVIATDLSLLRSDGKSDLHVVLGFNVLRKTDWYFDPQKKLWSVRH